MPQMPAGLNEQQQLALQVRIAQLRAQAALGGITGDPFGGLADALKNSPNAQRLEAIIKQQAEYYGPNANPALKGALTTAEEQSRTPEINKRETYKTDEQIRLEGQKAALNEQLDAWKQGRAAQFDFQPVTVKNPETGRLETRLIPKADYARNFNPNAGLPGVPAAPITPQCGPAAGAPPASGGPLGNNIVGTPVYPPGTEDMAKNAATAFGTAQQAETAANKHTQVLGQMAEAMKGFQPGASAELRYNGQRILKDLGFIQGNEVPSAETFQKAAAYLQFASVPKAQGSYSNTEREMFAPSIPRMVDSPEGLVKAINISLRLNDYDRQVAQIWRESVSATGVPDYAQAQERIAKLGPPLSPGEVAALQDIKEGKQPTKTNAEPPPPGKVRVWNPKTGRLE